MADATLVDLTKPGKFPVYLGDSLTSDDGDLGRGFTAISYNMKPAQTSTSRTATVRPSIPSTNVYALSLSDNDEQRSQYRYTGRGSKPKASYALLFDQSKQAFTLERIGAEYSFNLAAAPWEKDAEKNRKQYAQLDLAATADEASVDGDETSEADKDNPFDFRHWMNGAQQPSPSHDREKHREENISPLPKARNGVRKDDTKRKSKTGNQRPKSPERDDADDESSDAEDLKDGGLRIDMNPGTTVKRQTTARAPKRKEKPKGRLDGTASDDKPAIEANSRPKVTRSVEDVPMAQRQQQRPSYRSPEASSSDDGLTIDLGEEVKPRNRLGGEFARLSSAAPVSLRSAASSVSPASRRMSPAQEQSSESDEDEAEEKDVDVDEELTLPPPAVAQEQEEEDDLEAELAQALESEGVGMKKAESESESEEE
ncbi:MAG: hypothetical protein M1833_002736 [Piccolia ochrophora]|nr:MAG: hypothetical protein M1833_002736 [Piccolia ochrophora]